VEAGLSEIVGGAAAYKEK
jgi:hypothetical protein